MGLLDMISSVVRDATPGAIAARTGYLEGERQKVNDDEKRALEQAQLQEVLARGRYYDANAAGEPVQYVKDENDNYVPLPKRIRRDVMGATGASSPMSASTDAIPSFDATPSARSIDRALQGGSIADPNAPAPGLVSSLRNDVSGGQEPTLQIGKPSGVRAQQPKKKYSPFVAEDGTVYLRNPNDPTDVKQFKDENGDPITAHTPPGQQARTIIGADGFYHQWDSDSQSYVKTGVRVPDRLLNGSKRGGAGGSGSSAQDRLDALAAIKTAQAAGPRPSKVPQPDPMIPVDNGKGGVRVVPNPAYTDKTKDPAYQKAVSDSIAYDKGTMAPLREHLRDVTIGPNAKIGRFTPGAPPADEQPPDNAKDLPPGVTQTGSEVDLSGAGAKPQVDVKAMQREFDDAAAKLQDVLSSTSPMITPALKAQAKKAYEKHLAAIAQKYKATR